MLRFWRKNKLIDDQATRIADELYSQFPPSLFEDDASSRSSKKLTARWEKEIQSTVIDVRDAKATYNLGVYGKARFHLTFMERLREHGYAEDLVKEINEFLLVRTP